MKRRPEGTSWALTCEITAPSSSRVGAVTYSVMSIGYSLSPSIIRLSTCTHSLCVSMASGVWAREASRMRAMCSSSLCCGSTVTVMESMQPAGSRSKRAKASLPRLRSAVKWPMFGLVRMPSSVSALTGTPSNSNRPATASETGGLTLSRSAMSHPKTGAASRPSASWAGD